MGARVPSKHLGTWRGSVAVSMIKSPRAHYEKLRYSFTGAYVPRYGCCAESCEEPIFVNNATARARVDPGSFENKQVPMERKEKPTDRSSLTTAAPEEAAWVIGLQRST